MIAVARAVAESHNPMPCVRCGAEWTRMNTPGSTRRHGLAALLLAAGVIASLGAASDGDLRVPPIYPRDLALIDRALSIDDAQRPVVEALLAELAAAPVGDRGASARLVEALQAVLDPGQVAKLAAMCDAIRIERMESEAQVAGENIEVARVLAISVGEVDDARISGLLARYGRDLDPLLDARPSGDPLPPEDAASLATRLRIRDLNDATVVELAALLPEDKASRFMGRALALGYPTASGPADGVELLDALLKDIALPALIELRPDAAARAESVRSRAIAAIRQRDAARFASEAVRSAAQAAVTAAEKELERFDRWLYPTIIAAVPAEQLGATASGQSIIARARFDAQVAPVKWGDQEDTLREFDADRDGELNGEEASRMMEAFSKSVGKRPRWRL